MERNAARYEVKADRREFIAKLAAYVVIFLAAVAFVCMIFRASSLIARHHLNIDTWSYAEMHIYILLVEAVLWIVIAKAAIRFKAYTRRIKHSQDGAALNLIAIAMLLSLAYAILFDVASTFKSLFMGTDWLPTVTTITNLLPLGIFLLLSILLFAGSLKLSRLVPGSTPRQRSLAILGLAAFAVAVIPFGEYFYQVAPIMMDDDGLHHFALSPSMLVAVYLAPFILVWLFGLLSSLNLARYACQVPGKIYRPMFRNLYIGILTAYISTYLMQIWYVSNLPANTFGFGLVSIILLIVLLITGYAFMYRGVNQLYMLERGPTS